MAKGSPTSTGRHKYRAVLLDLDGVIIKSTYRPGKAKAALIQRLKRIGISLGNIATDSTIMEILDAAKAEVYKTRSRQAAETVIEEVLDEFDAKALSRSKLKPNARHVLRSLKNRQYKLGIVTSSGSQAVNYTLKRFGLQNMFDAIVTRNDVNRIKPDAEPVLRALTLLRCEPSRVVYVGDSWVDIKAGKSAGVVTVAITGGLGRVDRLRRESPKGIINSLNELPALVEKGTLQPASSKTWNLLALRPVGVS